VDQLQCDISNSDNRLNYESRTNSNVKTNEKTTNYSIIKERIGFDASKMLNNKSYLYPRDNKTNKNLISEGTDLDDNSKIRSHDSEMSK